MFKNCVYSLVFLLAKTHTYQISLGKEFLVNKFLLKKRNTPINV